MKRCIDCVSCIAYTKEGKKRYICTRAEKEICPEIDPNKEIPKTGCPDRELLKHCKHIVNTCHSTTIQLGDLTNAIQNFDEDENGNFWKFK